MSKAILVIDMPDDCSMCPCFQYGEDNYCAATGETNYSYKCARPTDCPLRPAPEKQDVWYDDNEGNAWVKGYNNCVREIMGE